MNRKQNSGVALIVVICFAAILLALSAGMLAESMTQTKIAQRQTALERAFFVAEGGAERAVSHICYGGVVPGTITGSIGDGKYITTILATEDLSGLEGGGHSVSGEISLNPNNSTSNEFLLVKEDGSILSKDDLAKTKSDQSGSAILLYFKPQGSGSQKGLSVDGSSYTIQNDAAYTFSTAGMDFSLFNTSRDRRGQAIGAWKLTLNGSSVGLSDESRVSGMELKYSIFSLGSFDTAKRIVLMEGIFQKSWAKYALWYHADAYGCWFKGGEKFYGPIHANCLVNFQDDPEFFKPLTTSKTTYGGNTNAVKFHEGFERGAKAGSMASVNFDNMRSRASMILTGETSVTLSGTNMLISNTRSKWSNKAVPIADDSLLYVQSASSGTSKDGWVKLGGNLKGRLTVVAQHNIMITNHITYSVHPTNNSTDALGLISGRDVQIETNCPNNTTLHAHIMATGNDTPSSTSDGKFHVVDYDKGDPRGVLTVVGGIVQYTRGPVGQFNTLTGVQTHGFDKHYTFDTRFAAKPPPFYPVISNEYMRTSWREMAP